LKLSSITAEMFAVQSADALLHVDEVICRDVSRLNLASLNSVLCTGILINWVWLVAIMLQPEKVEVFSSLILEYDSLALNRSCLIYTTTATVADVQHVVSIHLW